MQPTGRPQQLIAPAIHWGDTASTPNARHTCTGCHYTVQPIMHSTGKTDTQQREGEN